MPTVEKIEMQESRRKRVAAYARVSTRKDSQEDSFETQVQYYEARIRNTPDWILSGIYTDYGFSGVRAENRPGFMQMMEDAGRKKFDLLLVRSISRFARNAKEAQVFCRELRIHGIEVRFEREHISNTDPTAEMAFHLLAVCAQEESRSISERTKWSIHRLQEQGILHIGSKALGYREENGVLTPTDEAWAVREMFRRYAEGSSTSAIAEMLNRQGFCRKSSGKPMTGSQVAYILRNPIYVGDRLFQKQAPKNYITHKPDDSQAYDSFRVRDTHEGIVSRELWNAVQNRREQTEKLRMLGIRPRANSHFLYGKLFCGICGAPMKRKTVRSGAGRTAVWKCTARLTGKQTFIPGTNPEIKPEPDTNPGTKSGINLGTEPGIGCRNAIIKESGLLNTLYKHFAVHAESAEEKTAELMQKTDRISRIEVSEEPPKKLTFVCI